jgi:hypothetical protein
MKPTTGNLVKAGLLAMAATIGFDLFLHAGVLEPLYANPSPFLLSPEESFRRIPLGYLSFAIGIAILIWLMLITGVSGWKNGFIFGLKIGGLFWGSFALGLYSISTASQALLLGWFLGQSVEMGIGGMIIGSGLANPRLRPLLFRVVTFSILMVILGIVIQNIRNFSSS